MSNRGICLGLAAFYGAEAVLTFVTRDPLPEPHWFAHFVAALMFAYLFVRVSRVK